MTISTRPGTGRWMTTSLELGHRRAPPCKQSGVVFRAFGGFLKLRPVISKKLCQHRSETLKEHPAASFQLPMNPKCAHSSASPVRTTARRGGSTTWEAETQRTQAGALLNLYIQYAMEFNNNNNSNDNNNDHDTNNKKLLVNAKLHNEADLKAKGTLYPQIPRP